MFYGNTAELSNNLKTVIRSSLVTRSRFSEISYQWRVSPYNDHVLECQVTFWRGRLHNVLWDPYSTIELPEGQFQTFPEISLPKKLIWKSHSYQNKTFIREASPGIPYELWDKHTNLAIKATAWVLSRTPWRYFTGTTRIFFLYHDFVETDGICFSQTHHILEIYVTIS